MNSDIELMTSTSAGIERAIRRFCSSSDLSAVVAGHVVSQRRGDQAVGPELVLDLLGEVIEVDAGVRPHGDVVSRVRGAEEVLDGLSVV